MVKVDHNISRIFYFIEIWSVLNDQVMNDFLLQEIFCYQEGTFSDEKAFNYYDFVGDVQKDVATTLSQGLLTKWESKKFKDLLACPKDIL